MIGLRNYLYRTLLNLIANALKFTKEGFVQIEVKLIKNENNFSHIQFTVADSGIGIAPDKFDVIFEHFSRLTPSFEGVYKGSGLGLYAVQQYVKSMRGRIKVESEESKGSQFILTIPFECPINQPVQSQQSTTAVETAASIYAIPTDAVEDNREQVTVKKSDATHVLLVEDSKLAATAMKLVLTSLNCCIDWAESGAQAVTLANKKQYDIILMDIGLPDFSGIEATQRIRQADHCMAKNTPIIALTGHGGNTGIHEQALKAGIQEVLVKPAKLEQLANLLQKYAYTKK